MHNIFKVNAGLLQVVESIITLHIAFSKKIWSTYNNASIAEWLENTLIPIPELRGSNPVASNIIIFELFIAYYSKYMIVSILLSPYTISLIAEW